jgi:hypothetical protein
MVKIKYLGTLYQASGHGNAVLLLPAILPTAIRSTAMPSVALSTSLAASAAVLLVLLPPVGTAQPVRAATLAALLALQQQLGSAIRVLTVDEGTYPLVVRSFAPADLPAFVLVQRGVELWRQPGLPEGETIVAQLLSKLVPPLSSGG